MKLGEIMRKIIILLLFLPLFLAGQNGPHRNGTTAMNFLEIGFGSSGLAMGEAYVSMAEDISAIYWNPAGLAFMKHSEVQFSIQPWVVDINTSFAGAGMVIPSLGTIAVGLIYLDYGQMDVLTVDYPEGTGEVFSASDYAFSLSYARKITNWFGFGANFKYIGETIQHMSASALALDLGVRINTAFFSPTGERIDGLKIGMSISNYGTRMSFSGQDMLNYIDIEPDEYGNYGYAQAEYKPEEWELPLIFRLGMSLNVMKIQDHRITLALDAIHPNNNMETVNLGGEYELNLPAVGNFYLRGGYKALFLEDSEFGVTFGGGIQKLLMNNISLKIDYAYRSIGLLGDYHCYTFGFTF
ncbi:MAG TPA: PorV/PorQ family protein [Caldithrix sp.]|nr:PorV/PorQ family protein [Caldithrix sp.]